MSLKIQMKNQGIVGIEFQVMKWDLLSKKMIKGSEQIGTVEIVGGQKKECKLVFVQAIQGKDFLVGAKTVNVKSPEVDKKKVRAIARSNDAIFDHISSSVWYLFGYIKGKEKNTPIVVVYYE